MPFFPVDFEPRPDAILDWKFYGPFYWQAEVLDNLLAQQKAGKLNHNEFLQCLDQARQKAQIQSPPGLLESLQNTIHAAQSVYHSAQLAAQATAVQQPVQFTVPAVFTQPIPQPTETQSIPSQQVLTDPRIAREKLRKREQRKRKRSSVSKTTETQTTERETASQVQQRTQVLVSMEELGTAATLYKASGHGTARMETAWPTAASLDHANKDQEDEVLAVMGLHGWMFRDSG